MGNKSASIKSEIHNLFKVSSQAEFQTKLQRIMNMQLTASQVLDYVTASQVRDCIEQHVYHYFFEGQLDYFVFLFQYLVEFIRDLCHSVKNLNEELQRQTRNSLMLLSKFITVLHEPKYSDLNSRLLWGTQTNRMTVNEKQFRAQRVTLIQVNEPELDKQEVSSMLKPNLLVLLESLLKLCFYPNFTILPQQEQMPFNLENDHKLKVFLMFLWERYHQKVDLNVIWRGFGAFVKYPNDQTRYLENRIIVMQCMTACFGAPLFRPKYYKKSGLTASTSPPMLFHEPDPNQFVQHDEIDQGTKNRISVSSHTSVQRYKTLNSALIFFTSLHQGQLKELFVSLWGTILYHKYRYFWFQDNGLTVQIFPRILAQLCSQVLMFILSERIEYEEIARQIEFNSELHEVYQQLLGKLIDLEIRKDNGPEEELNALHYQDLQKTKSLKTIDLHIAQFDVDHAFNDCKQMFSNVIRDMVCSIESREFFDRSFERLLDNISDPFISESRWLTIKGFDMSNITESLGVLLFCLQHNPVCLSTVMEMPIDRVQQLLNILLYLQVKFAEGSHLYLTYVISCELMVILSRYEKSNNLISQQVSFAIVFHKVPNLTGSYGDFLLTLYGYLMHNHFKERMVKPPEQVFDVRCDLLSTIIFQFSTHIRSPSMQASSFLADAFYGHFAYDYLLQDPTHARTCEKLFLALNNILCYDLEANSALVLQLVKRRVELHSFLKFRLGKQHIRYHFAKKEGNPCTLATSTPKNKPISYLNTEKSELPNGNNNPIKMQSVNVSQVNSMVAQVGNQRDLEEEQKQSISQRTQPTQSFVQIQLTPEQEIRFEIVYTHWAPIIDSKIFLGIERLKQFLGAINSLGVKQGFNNGELTKEQADRLIRAQVWLGLMDRSFIVLSPQQPGVGQKQVQEEFQDLVLRNALGHQEWFPAFERSQIQYFKDAGDIN